MIYLQEETSHQAHIGRSNGITNVIPVVRVHDLLMNCQERRDPSVYGKEKLYFSHFKTVKYIEMLLRV
jgi:hypothetical protein